MKTENQKNDISPVVSIEAKTLKLAQKESYNSLLSGNRAWVDKRLKEDPDYFKKLSKGQSPEVLWIGCSDSRVPANEVTIPNRARCLYTATLPTYAYTLI